MHPVLEHIHTMKVGTKSVLFQAEVDAIDSGSLVEVNASNPHYWGTKVMFLAVPSYATAKSLEEFSPMSQ